MSYKQLKDFFWSNEDENHFIENEEKDRRYRLLKNALLITFPLTLFYAALFFYNQSYPNAIVQLIDSLLFIAVLIGLKKTGNALYWSKYYGLLSAISIYYTIYVTGGLFAIALPWILIRVPTCILLAGKRNGLLWWLCDSLFIAVIGYLHTTGHIFPPVDSKFTSSLSNILNSSFGLVSFMVMLSIIFENGKTRALSEVFKKNQLIIEETKKSDRLLLNILPEDIATELKETGQSEARQYDEVTVLFTDFENFTGITENLSPNVIINTLDAYFKCFDDIIEKFHLEKIKTIGDSYMAVAGLPHQTKQHCFDAVEAAFSMLEGVDRLKEEHKLQNKPAFDVRIGLYSGPVLAGIIGKKKFAYDIWGDTVNMASRMESYGGTGRINIGETTYELIKNKYNCEARGKIQVKNNRAFDMYFILNKKENEV